MPNDDTILTKKGSIIRIGNSIAIILPKAVVEIFGGISQKNLYDPKKKFAAEIEIRRNGDILIRKIDMRKEE